MNAISRLRISLALALLAAAPASGQAQSEPGATRRILIATPGVPTRMSYEGNELLGWITYGATSALTMGKGQSVSDSVASKGFDPSDRLTQALVAAMARHNRAASILEIQRKQTQRPGPLGRDELPAEMPEDAAWILDITILKFGLRRAVWTAGVELSVALNYRVIGARGDLLQHSRLVLFNASAQDVEPGISASGLADKDAIKPDPACRFLTSGAAIKRSAELAQCFDDAFAAMADRIAVDPIWDSSPDGSRF